MVAGMHRSGTSMLASLISELGFNLDERTLLEAPSYNPLGLAENRDILTINEKILKYHGITANEPYDITDIDPSSAFYQQTVAEIRQLYEKKLKKAKRLVVKDPRFCLTLPYWLDNDYKIQVVGIFRQPFGVASSLVARKDFATLTEGLRLWTFYNSKLLKNTKVLAPPPVFVAYEDIISQPVTTIRNLFTDLNEIDMVNIYTTVNPFLKHDNSLLRDSTENPKNVEQVLNKLDSLKTVQTDAGEQVSLTQLDYIVTSSINAHITPFLENPANYQSQIESIKHQISTLEGAVLGKLDERNIRYAKDIEYIYHCKLQQQEEASSQLLAKKQRLTEQLRAQSEELYRYREVLAQNVYLYQEINSFTTRNAIRIRQVLDRIPLVKYPVKWSLQFVRKLIYHRRPKHD